jgi:hypothetical protein
MLRPPGPAITAFRACALLVATTYFAFRTELVENEREEFALKCPVAGATISSPTVNWETYDKDNAPKGQRLVPTIIAEPLGFLAAAKPPVLSATPRFHPVRDKSPPSPLA